MLALFPPPARAAALCEELPLMHFLHPPRSQKRSTYMGREKEEKRELRNSHALLQPTHRPFPSLYPSARINVQPFSFFKENNGFRSYLAFHIKEFNVFHF